MRVSIIRRSLKTIGIALLLLLGLVLIGVLFFAVKVYLRKPVVAVHSTTHASIERTRCLDCHAPIAEEWRQSFHYKSVSGPYWKDVEKMGYISFFEKIRKPCMNCHAPANVLDLEEIAASTGTNDSQLGIECTPNILKEPKGIVPDVRIEHVELGVDCVSCHVSKRGIIGAGRHSTLDHETIADPRFQDPARTSTQFCRTCHFSAVEAWKKTKFADNGVTCLDCHMPFTNAPSVTGGMDRLRRSHRFIADKDETMLKKAIHGVLQITEDRKVRFRILNDRVGHYLPSGANWLLVYLKSYDTSGKILREHKEALGREETLLLDFWPFNVDKRIMSGGEKEIVMSLQDGHGKVEAIIRYWDWMHVVKTIFNETQRF